MNISMRNWLSYEDTGTIVIPTGFSLIRGSWVNNPDESNGTGKTAFIQSIPWVLWGEGRTTKILSSGDLDIRRPPEGRKSIVSLDYNGLVVNRSRSYAKNTTLSMIYNGETYDDKIALVQNEINDILRINHDLFRHTFYIALRESHLFTGLTPVEAKRRVSDMLDLARWEERRKRVSVDRIKLDDELVRIDTTIRSIKDRLDDHDDIKLVISELEFEIDDTDKKIVSINSERDVIISELEKYTKIVDDHNSIKMSIIDNKTKIDNLLNKKKAIINRINLSENKIEREMANINKIQSDIASFNDRIESYRKDIGDFDNESLLRDKKKHNDNILELNNKIQEYNNKISVLNTELSRYNNIINKLNSGITVCPITDNDCPIFTDAEYLNNELVTVNGIIDDKTKELDILTDIRDKCKNDISNISNSIDAIDAKLKLFDDIDANNAIVKASSDNIVVINKLIDNLKASIDSDEDALDDIRVEIRGLMDTIKSLEGSMDNIDDVLSKVNTYNNKIKELDDTLLDLHNNIDKTKLDLGKYREKLDRYNSDIDKISTLESTYKRILDEVNIINTIHDSFHINGIPTYIINMVTNEIESIANSILELVGHRSRIFIRLKKELRTKDKKTGKKKIEDDFTIGITDYNTGVEYTVDSDSGGESFWVDFSIRIALGICARERNDIFLNLFMIDEGIGVLAPPAQLRFLSAIRNISDRYAIDYIWLITHTPISDAVDYADNIITAWRDDDKSWIDVA